MFSKPLTMVLVALVGLAGFVAAGPVSAASCPDGTSDQCCGNPDVNKFMLSCNPYKEGQTCTGSHFCCGPTEDGGYKCGLPPA